MEKKKKEQEKKSLKRISKIGKWLRSDSEPLMDMSGLDEQEKAAMMRLILK